MASAAADRRIHVLIIGPGPVQVGGVATFIQFLMQSPPLNEKFALAHMDTARRVQDLATAGRFSFLNWTYFLRQVLALPGILRHYRPDIVHVSVTAGWSFWKVVVFMLVARAFGAKVVGHVHGGAFESFFERNSRIGQRLIAWGLRQADVVVALSPRWKDFFSKRVDPRLNVKVIVNCPDEALSQEAEAQLGAPSNNETVLFVGSIGKRKGIFDILRAIPSVVKQCNRASFVFLGEEEMAGEKEQVLQVCREAGLASYVKFPGRVTGPEKYRYFREASVFILPSHAENLPFALLEAMAVGLPVITTPVGGIPDVVEDGRNGYLIQPGDTTALSEKICLLLGNPDLRALMGARNREKIRRQFNAGDIAAQWEALYLDLLPARQLEPVQVRTGG